MGAQKKKKRTEPESKELVKMLATLFRSAAQEAWEQRHKKHPNGVADEKH